MARGSLHSGCRPGCRLADRFIDFSGNCWRSQQHTGCSGGAVVGLRSIGKDSSSSDGGNQKSQVSALPAALLVLGIALAAPLGILARTYHVFEPPAVRQAIAEQIRKTGKAGEQDRGFFFPPRLRNAPSCPR